MGELKLTEEEGLKLIRIIFEEGDRRSSQKDAKQLNDGQLVKLLVPDFNTRLGEILIELEKDKEENKIDPVTENAEFIKSFKEDKLTFIKKVKDEKKVKKESSEKAPEMSSEQTDAFVAKLNSLDQKIYHETFNSDSSLKAQVHEHISKFNRFYFYLKFYVKVLLDEGSEISAQLNEKRKLPLSFIEFVSIIGQNMMHPRNSHRQDAIEKGLYKEIADKDVATAYLDDIINKVAT